jgi:hypothetical protein
VQRDRFYNNTIVYSANEDNRATIRLSLCFSMITNRVHSLTKTVITDTFLTMLGHKWFLDPFPTMYQVIVVPVPVAILKPTIDSHPSVE